jgi:di/tricarboxylate transporter
MGFIMSYAASNTASAVITCPIAASLAIGAGFNSIPPILAAGLASSISSAIPSSTPLLPMAIVYSLKQYICKVAYVMHIAHFKDLLYSFSLLVIK